MLRYSWQTYVKSRGDRTFGTIAILVNVMKYIESVFPFYISERRIIHSDTFLYSEYANM